MAVSSTNKKVTVVRFDREALSGIASPVGFSEAGVVEIITSTGNLVRTALEEIKAVCFVKELPSPDVWKAHRLFSARPKSGGLWLRFRFKDEDTLDGVVPNNLLTFEVNGFSVVPPDPSFLNQRIFVPKAALLEAQVMGVIGAPLRQRTVKTRPKGTSQIEMFEE